MISKASIRAQYHIPLTQLLLAALIMLMAAAFWGSTARGAGVTPAGCTELIQNGGFEEGELGWQQASSGGYSLISDFNPRTGSKGAYLAGVNNANDRLSQQVILPTGVSTLRTWWALDTTETGGQFDKMTVSLLRPDGSLLADLVTVDNTAPVGLWDEIVIDLSPYAGQTVLLRFTGRTDASNMSAFYLDDISIMACVEAPSPTMTATATSTGGVTPPLPTATPTATATSTAGVTPPLPTATPTATATSTGGVTPPLRTATPTATATSTGGVTPPLRTATPTATATSTAGVTPPLPTATATVTPSATPSLEVTPTATATLTSTPGESMRRTYLPFIVR